MNYEKYMAPKPIPIKNRTWPSNTLVSAPQWVSVDLRDGNQALEVPMNLEQKIHFFNMLVKIGFKTIEIGFPAASETEYDFTRYIIEHNLIPQDVAIQVLTQSRKHIIDKTLEAVAGAPNVVIHLYNSTSAIQRNVVFGFGRNECIDLAVSGAKMIKDAITADQSKTNWILEYSPESFSATEPDFATEICDAVTDVWAPTPDKKVIINLPETVEMASPNYYADQVEYFCQNTRHKDSIIVSVHTHNDRGTAVAASELAMLAGATRVEGTLFGNGERTGNVDIITLAINMMMNGIDPKLDFSEIDELVEQYESATNMHVSERHPWAGKLVFTAFSGSHQDAIKKGIARMKNASDKWQVPYLPIDPKDVGRSYEPIIRINSQSGKGGVTYIMETHFGLYLPKAFQKDFGILCKTQSDHNSCELKPQEIFDLFDAEYVNVVEPYQLITFREETISDKNVNVNVALQYKNEIYELKGKGNGLLDAFCKALEKNTGNKIEITMYQEHAMQSGSDSAAITYVEISNGNGRKFIGAGISSSVTKSSLRAVVSAMNRMLRETETK